MSRIISQITFAISTSFEFQMCLYLPFFLLYVHSDLQTVTMEHDIDGQRFKSLAYATEQTDNLTTLRDNASDLNQVIVYLQNKKILMLYLDDDNYTDFEMWTESEAVVICDPEVDLADSDNSKKKQQNMTTMTVSTDIQDPQKVI